MLINVSINVQIPFTDFEKEGSSLPLRFLKRTEGYSVNPRNVILRIIWKNSRVNILFPFFVSFSYFFFFFFSFLFATSSPIFLSLSFFLFFLLLYLLNYWTHIRTYDLSEPCDAHARTRKSVSEFGDHHRLRKAINFSWSW